MQQTGVLRGDLRWIDPDFLDVYHWLMDEMRLRLGPPPTPTTYPIWLWVQSSGVRRRPDLRRTGHLSRGTRGVRLELAIDERSILPSDYMLWHYSLNYFYLPASTEDDEAFDKLVEAAGHGYFQMNPSPDPVLHTAIQTSWRRIFDLDWDEPGITHSVADKVIQATTWEIRMDQIRRVDAFVAR